MQVLHTRQTHVTTVQDVSMMSSLPDGCQKDATPGNFEVKENRSSNGSLLIMNPVASGDNVTINNGQKLKEDLPSLPSLPSLVPCCEGRELQINEELVRTGLSKISVKHETSVIQTLSMSQALERMQVAPGLIKHRNSFRNLQRPDLKGVPYLRRLTPDDLESLFRGDKEDISKGVASQAEPEEKPREKLKETGDVTTADNGNKGGPLHPIHETRSGFPSDIPVGMRLHGARARLYTSVLAGSRVGDHLDGEEVPELDACVPDEPPVPEDEVQSNEELQIILAPQLITGQSSATESESSSPAS